MLRAELPRDTREGEGTWDQGSDTCRSVRDERAGVPLLPVTVVAALALNPVSTNRALQPCGLTVSRVGRRLSGRSHLRLGGARARCGVGRSLSYELEVECASQVVFDGV